MHCCEEDRPMPRVTIRTGTTSADGREEEISEYLCDSPNCPNIATQVLGCVREFGFAAVVCDDHAPRPVTRPVRERRKTARH
jgi:hypothetical protein